MGSLHLSLPTFTSLSELLLPLPELAGQFSSLHFTLAAYMILQAINTCLGEEKKHVYVVYKVIVQASRLQEDKIRGGQTNPDRSVDVEEYARKAYPHFPRTETTHLLSPLIIAMNK